ncbi:hypothetical protein H696_01539 [Fonticula alba]|uniref:Eukaryotic translation initiation factor 3 subunit L n=1 Tax=Fonticula alba TaxID=691883 RepID=A0A058ZDY2_FONAL|nr:hypothetical protein H696_01539 [Fonticula alba]KCV72133.1 hypothetical protein H696_01539 [Fonticula alba]|eukprot:XP_009493711.1 hypothetical protein H696_01539 [Fonticula alba]
MSNPHYDNDYDSDVAVHSDSEQSKVPTSVGIDPSVLSFITHFYNAYRSNNNPELQRCYTMKFSALSKRHFAKSTWPAAEEIASLVNNDEFFLILYKELYFRHIYANSQPTLEQSIGSYDNYVNLFNFITQAETPITTDIPIQWLWDMVDELIYQFGKYVAYRRSPTKPIPAADVERIHANPHVWDVKIIISLFQYLVQQSNINEILIAASNDQDESEVAGEFGSILLYRNLGYFSLIGLLRINCLLGDFHYALEMVKNIQFSKTAFYNRIIPCRVSLFYHVGFCQVMLRRYSEAASTFTDILFFITKADLQHMPHYLQDAIHKNSAQMVTLLAICVTLCPPRYALDEAIAKDLSSFSPPSLPPSLLGPPFLSKVFEEWFKNASPRFITYILPTPEQAMAAMASKQVEVSIPQRMFMRDIRQQLLVPKVRSYLRLYTSLTISKLASFLEADESEVRSYLLNYKHKTRSTQGSTVSYSDVDFHVIDDIVHISEVKPAANHSQYFLRQISSLDEQLLSVNINTTTLRAGAGAANGSQGSSSSHGNRH